MVKACCVRDCSSKVSKSNKAEFHKFPANEKIKKKWMDALRVRNKVTSTSLVCDRHFVSSDFKKVKGETQLKASAVPSVECGRIYSDEETSSSSASNNCEEIIIVNNETTSNMDTHLDTNVPVQNGEKDSCARDKDGDSRNKKKTDVDPISLQNGAEDAGTLKLTKNEEETHQTDNLSQSNTTENLKITASTLGTKTNENLNTETLDTEKNNSKDDKSTNELYKNDSNTPKVTETSKIDNKLDNETELDTKEGQDKLTQNNQKDDRHKDNAKDDTDKVTKDNANDDTDKVTKDKVDEENKLTDKQNESTDDVIKDQSKTKDDEIKVDEIKNKDEEHKKTDSMEGTDLETLITATNIVKVPNDSTSSTQEIRPEGVFISGNQFCADSANSSDCEMLVENVQVDVDPESLMQMMQEPDEEEPTPETVEIEDDRPEEPVSLLTSSDDDDVILEEPHIDTVEVSDETDEDEVPLKRLCNTKPPPTQTTNLTQQTSSINKLFWGGMREFYCYLCPYVAKSQIDLKEHMLVHNITVPTTNDETLPDDNETQKEILVCEICHYQTASKYQFQNHKKKHKEEKKYKCNSCDYRAKHRMSLVYHMRSHENIDDIFTYRFNKDGKETEKKRKDTKGKKGEEKEKGKKSAEKETKGKKSAEKETKGKKSAEKETKEKKSEVVKRKNSARKKVEAKRSRGRKKESDDEYSPGGDS